MLLEISIMALITASLKSSALLETPDSFNIELAFALIIIVLWRFLLAVMCREGLRGEVQNMYRVGLHFDADN